MLEHIHWSDIHKYTMYKLLSCIFSVFTVTIQWSIMFDIPIEAWKRELWSVLPRMEAISKE